MRPALVLGSALVCAACSGPAEPDAVALSAAVVNGQPSLDGEDDNVVDVYATFPDRAPTRCTGTLVAPDIVLTALHCIAFFDNGGQFSCGADGTLTSVSDDGGVIGQPVDAASVTVHVGTEYHADADARGVRVFGTGSTQICRNDVALVVLDRELAPEGAVLRLDRPTLKREAMRIVGFGQTEGDGSSGRHARRGVRVTDVGPDDSSSVGTAAPRTFVLGEGACHGDSGGPAFTESTGALAGVYSLSGGPTCTSVGVRNVYTRLAPFAYLVEQAFEFAGREPRLEPGLAGSGGTAPDANGGGHQGGGGTSANHGGETEPPEGDGSGSRDDPSCTCESVGVPSTGASGAWSAIGLVLVTVVRRRRKPTAHRRTPSGRT